MASAEDENSDHDEMKVIIKEEDEDHGYLGTYTHCFHPFINTIVQTNNMLMGEHAEGRTC